MEWVIINGGSYKLFLWSRDLFCRATQMKQAYQFDIDICVVYICSWTILLYVQCEVFMKKTDWENAEKNDNWSTVENMFREQTTTF